MNEYIGKLVQQGFKVFPCNADKTPAISKGFYNATNDIERLQKLFYRDDLLIGLPTGNINNLVVIDFDVNKKIPGTEDIDPRSIDELIEALEEIIKIPFPKDTLQIETPSGGRHFYFKTESTKLSSATRFFDNSLPIDLRASGGYVVFADDRKYFFYDTDGLDINDIKKSCLPLPEVIENYQKPYIDTQSELEILPASEVREIRSALSFLSSDDRDMWIRVGFILKSTGSPSAYGLWNEWSKTSSKYNPDDMEKRWQGLKPKDIEIGSLFFEAAKFGWVTTYEDKPVEKIQPKVNLGIIKNKEICKPDIPKEVLEPTGLVGELMDYMIRSSIKIQPIYALACSLATIGTLQGRKIATDTNVRTNLYCLGVGTSGSGKDSPRKAVKNCFNKIGAAHICSVEELASDAAIITSMSEGRESQIYLLDEIGRFLKTTGEFKNTHLYNVVSVLLKLYSSADTIYSGKSYADEAKQKKITNPNLCIYGTTVPDSLYKGLTIDHINNGFLSRILIFESDEDPRKKHRRQRMIVEPPPSLLEKMNRWYRKPINSNPVGNIDHLTPGKPDIVSLTEDAISILENFEDYLHELKKNIATEFHSIYSRTAELAEKVALIIAAGNNFDNPVITEKEIIYGIKLTKYLSDYLLYIANNFMADSQYEHEVKNILKIIREHGQITKSILTRKTQKIQTYVRNDILETLKNSKQIEEIYEGDGPAKTTIYIAL